MRRSKKEFQVDKVLDAIYGTEGEFTIRMISESSGVNYSSTGKIIRDRVKSKLIDRVNFGTNPVRFRLPSDD